MLGKNKTPGEAVKLPLSDTRLLRVSYSLSVSPGSLTHAPVVGCRGELLPQKPLFRGVVLSCFTTC